MRIITIIRIVLSFLPALWVRETMNAQTLSTIIPDNTLGPEASIIVQQDIDGLSSARIDGGSVRGRNLFHSFSEFSIELGKGGFFSSPTGIQNIISRVTGNNASDIQGNLGVLGSANLFFLNSRGINFGPNSTIQVNGSFLATTAESYLFENNEEFSRMEPQPPSLLSINVPVGLQFGKNTGDISSRSQAFNQPTPFSFRGLQVSPRETLAFLGGDISIDSNENNAGLSAPGGRIEIGSVADKSLVYISPDPNGLTFDYRDVSSFRDIIFSNGTNVSVTSPETDLFGSGEIRLQGREISLLDDSSVQSINTTPLPGGDIVVVASESVILDDNSSLNTFPLIFFAEEIGLSGDISITASDVIIKSSFIRTFNSTSGSGGNIVINSSNKILVDSEGTQPESLSNLISDSGNGRAGDIKLYAQELQLRDGARITSRTVTGRGGDIVINVSKSVDVIGQARDPFSLSLVPSLISADAELDGEGGSVMINSIVENEKYLNTTPVSINIRDGGIVSVTGAEMSNAGNIDLSANSLTLDRQAVISAEAANGEGGNIKLTIDGLLQLSGNSQISTASTMAGNGGNIDILSQLIFASPLENSDISSSAFVGNGGDISLSTRGLFGIEPREEFTLDNDIVASSEFGLSGTISIEIPGADPSESLSNLPSNIVDSTQLISSNCSRPIGDPIAGKFTMTGRGGVESIPTGLLTSDSSLTDWTPQISELNQSVDSGKSNSATIESINTDQSSIEFQEATHWKYRKDGRVFLARQKISQSIDHDNASYSGKCSSLYM